MGNEKTRQGFAQELNDFVDFKLRKFGDPFSSSGIKVAPTTYGDLQPGGSSGVVLGWHDFYVKGTGTEIGIAAGDFVDGAQTEFIFEDSVGDPISIAPDGCFVYLNGIYFRAALYTIGDSKITFGTAPPNGAELMGKVSIG